MFKESFQISEHSVVGKALSSRVRAGMYVPGATERVAATYTWLHQVLQERVTSGGLAVSAPVLANMYRSLTEGYRAFQSCRTLVDTPVRRPRLVLLLLVTLGDGPYLAYDSSMDAMPFEPAA